MLCYWENYNFTGLSSLHLATHPFGARQFPVAVRVGPKKKKKELWLCHRPPEGLRSLPIMSAHVNIDITNVSSCIYITIPYFTSVGQTTLESIGWCLACELDVTSGAILINPGNKISQTPSMNQFYHLSQGKKKEITWLVQNSLTYLVTHLCLNWWNSCLMGPEACPREEEEKRPPPKATTMFG